MRAWGVLGWVTTTHFKLRSASMPTSPSDPSKARKSGPRVALLVSYLSNEYEWAITRGVRAVVEAAGGTLLCVAGGALSDPSAERTLRNAAYDLIDATNADALVVVSSVLGQYIGSERTTEWLKRYPQPICSIGHLRGFPSIEIDDADGLGQLIDHLIEYHGHQRIAFIGGPEGNVEATARHAAYAAALEQHGIRYAPELVVTGEFTWQSGAKALRSLLDERQITISTLDAIVAANDYMAFGVMDELTRRRIAVPEQVAVVGFDDMPRASVHQPALTTVKQSLEELGREAARNVLAQLAGQEVESSTALPTELVLRRSCGCTPTDVPGPADEPGSSERPAATERLQPRGGVWSVELVAALVAEANGQENAFERALDPLLQKLLLAGIDLSLVYDLVLFLGQRALRQVGDESVFGVRIEAALQRARVLVSELSLRSELLPEDSVNERIHRFGRALLSRMFGPPGLLSAVLVEHLPGLGMHECLVSETGPALSAGELRVAFGFDAHEVQPKQASYPARELAPPEFVGLSTQSVFVLPAVYADQLLGVALLPVCGHDGSVYETLAEVFGIALKGVEMRRNQ